MLDKFLANWKIPTVKIEKSSKIELLTAVEDFTVWILPSSLVLFAEIEEAQVLNDSPWTIAHTTNRDPSIKGISS